MPRLIPNDVFGAAFELTTLLETINRIPYKEGMLGQLFDWQTVQSWTEDVRINSTAGAISVLPSIDRDGVAPHRHIGKRKGVPVTIPAYAERFGFLNRSLLGVSAGLTGEDALEAVTAYRDQHLAETTASLDLTMEHQRARALTGDVVDTDGVHIANMYDVMGVDQIEVDINLSSGAAGGSLQQQLTEAVEIGEIALGGDTATNWKLIATKDPSTALMKNKGYIDAQNELNSVRDRQVDGRLPVRVGNLVDIHHYRRNDFLPDGAAFLVPVIDGGFKTVYGPSDQGEFLGNILPRYPLVTEIRGDRGQEVEIWSFFLNYQTRPEACIKLNFVS